MFIWFAGISRSFAKQNILYIVFPSSPSILAIPRTFGPSTVGCVWLSFVDEAPTLAGIAASPYWNILKVILGSKKEAVLQLTIETLLTNTSTFKDVFVDFTTCICLTNTGGTVSIFNKPEG